MLKLINKLLVIGSFAFAEDTPEIKRIVICLSFDILALLLILNRYFVLKLLPD